MNTMRTIFVGCAAAVLLGAVVWALPQEPAGQGEMSERQWQELQRQAEQWGLTPEELKQFIERQLGTPLLFDRRHKVAVAWQAHDDGGVKSIRIVADATGPERVYVDYQLGREPKQSQFTYGSAAREGDMSLLAVAWQDLNSDGVFDVLVVAAKHHELLKLDRGAYILIDGSWAAARREDGDRDVFVAGEARYVFDDASGTWQRVKP